MEALHELSGFIYPKLSISRRYVVHLDEIEIRNCFQQLIDSELYTGTVDEESIELIGKHKVFDFQSFYDVKVSGDLKKINDSNILNCLSPLKEWRVFGTKFRNFKLGKYEQIVQEMEQTGEDKNSPGSRARRSNFCLS